MKDFTESGIGLIRFKIDDDVFECAGKAPMGAIEDVVDIVVSAGKLEGADLNNLTATAENMALATSSIQKTIEFIDTVMLPESAKRFAARMRDPSNPITSDQVVEISRWLMEQYAARPTTPPSPSLNGHGGTGESSTAPVPAEGSIPEPSLSTASST